MTRKAGIRTRGFFIIGHLKETRESIMATIKFMKEVALDDFHFTYFTPLPGTDAYSIADEYGTFDKSFSKTSMQYPVFIPNGLSANEMEKYSKQAYRSFYFRPEILISYFVLLVRFPRNAVRLLNGIRALFSRIFSPNNLSTGTK
jgi:radical SAM superfamily enzyme YgiQ (UPF0313 family)